MRLVKIKFGAKVFLAEFFDTPTAKAIYDSLPFSSSVMTWGDEIYFQISATASLEKDAHSEVAVGDLAYWPTMPAFCIFFGPTPASEGNEPRAASAVNVFGRLLDFEVEELRSIRDGDEVEIVQ